MKRLAWVLVIVGVGVAAAVSLVALPRGSEWTTTSSEALDAFQQGDEALGKLYHRDAAEHFARALELDSEFVAAKIELANLVREGDSKQAEKLRSEALAADRDRLTPRERLMLDRLEATRDKKYAESNQLVEDYLKQYPDDPRALALKAARHFSRSELDDAQRIYQRLVEVNPNWVLSYNQLGYIAMQKARFAEAEEHFTSYRFIAPDQANPHDSLGELFVILGRYEEAAESFERAIEIKDDFWNSYLHLMIVRIMTGDFDAADAVVKRAVDAEALDDDGAQALRCIAECWRGMTDHDWKTLAGLMESDPACLENPMASGTVLAGVHRASCVLGQYDRALKLEGLLGKIVEKTRGSENSGQASAGLLHMQGVRLASQGELADAEERLREADGNLVYKNADIGLFKLFNRLTLIEVLLARGHQAEAHALLSQVRMVNPTMVARFEADGLEVIGLR